MTRRPVSITLLALVLAGSASLWLGAQTPTREIDSSQIPIDADDIAGVGHERARPGGRRLGDCGDHRHADQVPQDRRHRRPGAVPAARSPGRRATYTSGCAATASSIRRRSARRPGGARADGASWRPTPRAAAQIYPANYWYSLIDIPPEKRLSRHRADRQRHRAGDGDAAPLDQPDQGELQRLPPAGQPGDARDSRRRSGRSRRASTAWDRRVQVGPGRRGDEPAVDRARARSAASRCSPTGRIGSPPAKCRRRRRARKGVERNLVLTMWDWGGPATFAHDELTTDKRNPTANAYGPIYGVDWGNDGFLTLDPLEHTAKETRIPVLDPKVPPGKPQSMPVPSPYWGDKLYWFDPAITNHAAMDSKGRVWMSSRFRVPENQPAFCNDHPSAALAPQPTSFRQIQYYDPKTQQFKQVDICFDTHHVQFASDADETLYGNGVFSGAIGWVEHARARETGDAGAAQGWCRRYFDVNGDGKIDPAVDREIKVGLFYSVIPHPTTAASGAPCRDRCRARSSASIRRPA